MPYHTFTILYYTIPYHTIPYHTIPYHTIPYHTILYYTMLCYTVLYYIIYTIYYILYIYMLYAIYYILYTLYYVLFTIYYILFCTILCYVIPYENGPHYSKICSASMLTISKRSWVCSLLYVNLEASHPNCHDTEASRPSPEFNHIVLGGVCVCVCVGR